MWVLYHYIGDNHKLHLNIILLVKHTTFILSNKNYVPICIVVDDVLTDGTQRGEERGFILSNIMNNTSGQEHF